MTRYTIYQKGPSEEQPQQAYHLVLDCPGAHSAIKLLFLNYPSSDDLLEECDAIGSLEHRFLVESADWPTAWTHGEEVLRLEVPGENDPLGIISVEAEVIVINAGRLALEVRE